MVGAHRVEIIAGRVTFLREQRVIVTLADQPLTWLEFTGFDVLSEYILQIGDILCGAHRRGRNICNLSG